MAEGSSMLCECRVDMDAVGKKTFRYFLWPVRELAHPTTAQRESSCV